MAALKTRLSEAARIELAKNLDAFWMVELLEVLRTSGAFSDRKYSRENLPLSQLEHQALNGSFREGFGSCVQLIPQLAEELKEPQQPKPQFGNLLPIPSDPKSLSQAPKPQPAKV